MTWPLHKILMSRHLIRHLGILGKSNVATCRPTFGYGNIFRFDVFLDIPNNIPLSAAIKCIVKTQTHPVLRFLVIRPLPDTTKENECPTPQRMSVGFRRCAFEDDVFLDRVVDVVTAHSASQPIFLYWVRPRYYRYRNTNWVVGEFRSKYSGCNQIHQHS